MDHRWGNRIAIHIPVRMVNPNTSAAAVGHLINVSLDGALVAGSPEAHIGARIQISLAMPEAVAACGSWIDAYLVRKAGAAVALQWAEFAPREIVALVRGLRAHPLQVMFMRESHTQSASSGE